MNSDDTAARLASSVNADADLADRLRHRDEAAYAELWQRFGAALHGFAESRMAGDREGAEEIVVQALADAVRYASRFNPRQAPFAAWVHGIARRHIQAELRRRQRRKSVPASAHMPLESAADVPGDRDMARDAARRIDAQTEVAELARVLSDIEMDVLILRFGQGLSVREIAQIVRRSERAIDSMLHRAKRKARERLGEDDE